MVFSRYKNQYTKLLVTSYWFLVEVKFGVLNKQQATSIQQLELII
jgi:hypothetical protein